MLAAMSHDLKTPLTRLRLRAEFVQDEEQQRKMLADLDAMNAMIESTLAFACDDAQHEPRILVDLGALVESVCENAIDAGGAVTFTAPRALNVTCRPTAISRAIANLLDNAIKYGGTARVVLAQAADHVVIMIDDEGPGIPPEERERVFAPFYRLEPSRNPDTGGVGLGLAVARTIAREHGGDVTLSNRMTGGLRVRVELPILIGDETKIGSHRATPGAAAQPKKSIDGAACLKGGIESWMHAQDRLRLQQELTDALPREAVSSVPKLANRTPFAFVIDSLLVRAADNAVAHRHR
jgi:signal transduction histidine kinase